jgi:hypothetical protein
MSSRSRFRVESPHPVGRRLRAALARFLGDRLQKSIRVTLVTIEGVRFKRVEFPDSYAAARIEHNLELFSTSEHFPSLVTRYENEVWVKFVDGDRVTTIDENFTARFADFCAELFAHRARSVPAAESMFPSRLTRDLGFLHAVSVLPDALHREISAVADRLCPPRVWVGFDYRDPVLKNFVLRRGSGTLCAIDIESLRDEQLIGIGIAKALLRWLHPFRDTFFDRLTRDRVPDIRSDFPFIELCFLASWTKRNFLERKWRSVDLTLFDRFRERATARG